MPGGCQLEYLALTVVAPSFHYHPSPLPDTYNPISFYRSTPARAGASLHRHKHIDPKCEPANSEDRDELCQIHSHTINKGGRVKVLRVLSVKVCRLIAGYKWISDCFSEIVYELLMQDDENETFLLCCFFDGTQMFQMLNGLRLFSAFLVISTTQSTLHYKSHSFIHSHRAVSTALLSHHIKSSF